MFVSFRDDLATHPERLSEGNTGSGRKPCQYGRNFCRRVKALFALRTVFATWLPPPADGSMPYWDKVVTLRAELWRAEVQRPDGVTPGMPGRQGLARLGCPVA
jgi:hypothetical protein